MNNKDYFNLQSALMASPSNRPNAAVVILTKELEEFQQIQDEQIQKVRELNDSISSRQLVINDIKSMLGIR